jgi:hypothetical protein
MTSAIQHGIAGLLLYASLAHGALMAHPSQISRMAVATAEELFAATQNKKVGEINISADLADLSALRLMPGQTLRSASDRHVVLSFRPEADGLEVTTDNSVFGLDVRVTPTHRAIWNDRTVDSLGTLVIRSIRTIGSAQIIATDKVRSGRIEVDGLDIRSADTRGERERPHAYGYLSFKGPLLSGTSSLIRRWRFLRTSSICRLAGSGFLCWVPAYLWPALAKGADG